MLLAVAKDTREYGVDVGKPWRERYDILPLAEALDREYKTDAHAVGYIVTRDGHALAAQPRLTKPGLDYARQLGFDVTFNTILVDIDNPDHGAWTEDALEASIERLAALPSCAWYTTRGGLHIVQPLATPVPIDVAELYIRSFFYEVQDAGFAVDWSTTDWTRHFRMPFAKRSGKVFAPRLDHANVKPIALAPIAGLEPITKTRRKLGTPVRVDWRTELPAHWTPKLERLALGMRATDVTDNWHKSFLALAAALLSRGAPAEEVPLVIQTLSFMLEDRPQKSDGRISEAKSTVDLKLRGGKVAGYASLPIAIQLAVDDAMARGDDKAARDRRSPESAREAPELIAERMANVMRNLPDGLTIIKAECGAGKTQAAMRVAHERAADGLKTGLSFLTHALAIEKYTQLRAEGHRALRVFGALSHETDGKPTCVHHTIARPLVSGGQSLDWEFCQGRKRQQCTEYLTCRARIGHEGDEDAKIVFGQHNKISAIDDEVGSRGLLFIDEPPAPFRANLLTEKALDLVVAHRDMFVSTYIDVMLPYVEAMRTWTGEGEAPRFDVAHALDEGSNRKNPPLTLAAMAQIRHAPMLAAEIGAASGVLDVLYRISTSRLPADVTRDERGIRVLAADEAFAAAINRDGSVVVADATPDVPMLSKLIRDESYVPPVHVFEVEDGAKIERTVYVLKSCKRSDLVVNGKVNRDALARALRHVVTWLDNVSMLGIDTNQIAIIAPRAVRVMLQNLHGPADRRLPPPKLMYHDLADYLTPWHGRITWGHYGAVRGLDTMKHVDALITIGDPFPDLGTVRQSAEFVGVDPSERLVALTRDELEQAHGRMRVVHRTRPGAMVHVGSIAPGGSGWRRPETIVVPAPAGRPKGKVFASVLDVTRAVDRMGSVAALADELGVDQGSVHRWLRGERRVPEKYSGAICM